MIRKISIENFYDFAAGFGNCRHEGGVDFRSGKKPEALLQLLLKHFSDEGDLVLDSFLGSGTTAAVAHKMRRRRIGIELGEHAYSHCKTRLDRVVDGNDPGGITKSVEWTGGGGFGFFELAPELIVRDQFGAPIINPSYTYEMLCAAVALHENCTYAPDPSVFWKQSRGSEHAWLYVTDQYVSTLLLELIAAQMSERDFLTIACFAHDAGLEHANKKIRVRRLPQMLLDNRGGF